MSVKLFFESIIKFVIGAILVGLLLFIPAGTFKYINGLLFMCLLFIPMFIVGIIMMIKSPNLLKERLDVKEKDVKQKKVVGISAVMFILGFVVVGLNYRYSWIKLPNIVVIISSVIFILSYIMYAVVLKQNAFLARTIKVDKDQKLITTGLYSIVRHPMYTATIFLFLSMPLVLNSLISFIIFLIYPFVIVARINNEEEVLEKELKGYKEYRRKVRYKLIPFIW